MIIGSRVVVVVFYLCCCCCCCWCGKFGQVPQWGDPEVILWWLHRVLGVEKFSKKVPRCPGSVHTCGGGVVVCGLFLLGGCCYYGFGFPSFFFSSSSLRLLYCYFIQPASKVVEQAKLLAKRSVGVGHSKNKSYHIILISSRKNGYFGLFLGYILYISGATFRYFGMLFMLFLSIFSLAKCDSNYCNITKFIKASYWDPYIY